MFDILGQVVAGWMLADALTGAVHWWEDRWPAEDESLLGKWVVAPNRLHHREPLAFTANGFWVRSSTTIATASAIGLAGLLLFGPSYVLLTAWLGGCLANEVHVLTHKSRLPRWASILQEVGVIQSRQHHYGHHRHGDRRYCILTDWLNPVLDGLGFWGHLEKGLERVGFKLSKGEY